MTKRGCRPKEIIGEGTWRNLIFNELGIEGDHQRQWDQYITVKALSSFEWVRDDVMPDASFPCEPREQLGKLSGVSSSLSSRIADKKRWMPAFLV